MLTDKQIELISHALGADKFYEQKGFYRNRFACFPGSEDFHNWRELQSLGYAEINDSANLLNSQMVFFHCTERADTFMRDQLRKKKHAAPKVSRSKKIYAAYLEVAECYESFAHYLGVKR